MLKIEQKTGPNPTTKTRSGHHLFKKITRQVVWHRGSSTSMRPPLVSFPETIQIWTLRLAESAVALGSRSHLPCAPLSSDAKDSICRHYPNRTVETPEFSIRTSA